MQYENYLVSGMEPGLVVRPLLQIISVQPLTHQVTLDKLPKPRSSKLLRLWFFRTFKHKLIFMYMLKLVLKHTFKCFHELLSPLNQYHGMAFKQALTAAESTAFG